MIRFCCFLHITTRLRWRYATLDIQASLEACIVMAVHRSLSPRMHKRVDNDWPIHSVILYLSGLTVFLKRKMTVTALETIASLNGNKKPTNWSFSADGCIIVGSRWNGNGNMEVAGDAIPLAYRWRAKGNKKSSVGDHKTESTGSVGRRSVD